MSAEIIRNNWETIKKDPYNNRPDIEDVEEYIAEARKGNVTAGGVLVVITSKIASSVQDNL
jgi:hypothetical protein